MIMYQENPNEMGGGMTLDEAFDILGDVLEATREDKENTKWTKELAKGTAKKITDKIPGPIAKSMYKRNYKVYMDDDKFNKYVNLGSNIGKKLYGKKYDAAFGDGSYDAMMDSAKKIMKSNYKQSLAGMGKSLADRGYDVDTISKQMKDKINAKKEAKAVNASADMLREACLTILAALDNED